MKVATVSCGGEAEVRDATPEEAAQLNAGWALPVSLGNVRDEAQRRIIALVGATDLNDCLIKQLNANALAGQLNDFRFSRALTPQEEATATALRNMFATIQEIRAASNKFGDKIPQDYRDDKFWPEAK